MINLRFIDSSLPFLRIDDTVSKALDLFAQFKFTHLPVIDHDIFIGLLSEDSLLEVTDSSIPLRQFKHDFIESSVRGNLHFLKTVAFSRIHHCNLIPVTNDEKVFLGSIRGLDLLQAVGDFAGASDGGAIIVLEMERSQLSFSEINSIVENDGASISHLNVSPVPGDSGIHVTIQINQYEVAAIIATFERYEYSVVFYSGEELFENEINANYQNLMNYLDI